LVEIGLAVYEELSFKVKVYRWTEDRRWTKSDHKSQPCHFVTGELKKYNVPGVTQTQSRQGAMV
jgi:hypothetical protein